MVVIADTRLQNPRNDVLHIGPSSTDLKQQLCRGHDRIATHVLLFSFQGALVSLNRAIGEGVDGPRRCCSCARAPGGANPFAARRRANKRECWKLGILEGLC